MHPNNITQLPLFTIVQDGTCQGLPQIAPITKRQIKDLAGQRFGRLVVLGFVGQAPSTQAKWLCKCDCGNYHVVVRGTLVSGYSRSCGCLAQESSYISNRTHGMTGTPEWKCWTAIKSRCLSPGSTGFEHWGGRGITICAHWRDDFENFYNDMGPKPGQGHDISIDRIDVNGHYSCGHCEQCKQEGWTANCRWATLEEQLNNTRGNRYLEFQGERMTIAQWARKLHIHYEALHWRISAGWSVEKALTTPAKRYD